MSTRNTNAVHFGASARHAAAQFSAVDDDAASEVVYAYFRADLIPIRPSSKLYIAPPRHCGNVMVLELVVVLVEVLDEDVDAVDELDVEVVEVSRQSPRLRAWKKLYSCLVCPVTTRRAFSRSP